MSTTLTVAPTPPGPPARPRRERHAPSFPAWALVVVYLTLLMAIPAGLVLPALGAAGTPATVFGLLLLAWWICANVAGQTPRAHGVSPVHLALGFLALILVLSWANGVGYGWVRPVDVREITDAVWTHLPIDLDDLHSKSTLAGIRGLIAVMSWIGVALVLSDGLRTWGEFDRVVTVVVWFAAAISLVGIIQFVTGSNLAEHIRLPGLVQTAPLSSVERSGFSRVQATATHPIEFGVALAALLPLALHQSLERARGWYDHVPVAALALAVPMSVSRSGILVLGAVFVVLFFGWSGNRRAWSLVVAPMAILAMRAVFPGLVGTIRSLFTSAVTDPSVAGRTSDYGVIMDIYVDHPWLGRGQSTFMPAYYRTLDNQFVMSLVELGLLGLLAVLWVLIATVYTARYVRRHSPDPVRQHLGLCLVAGIVGIYLSYATFDAFSFPLAAGTTFLLIGLAGAAWRLTRQDEATMSAEGAGEPAADREVGRG